MSWNEHVEIPWRGMNSTDDPSVLEPGFCTNAQNVEFTNRIARKRNGTRKANQLAIRIGALRFDGTSGWVLIPRTGTRYDDTGAGSITREFTIEAAVQMGALSGADARVIVSKTDLSLTAGNRIQFALFQTQSGGNERFQAAFEDGTNTLTITPAYTPLVDVPYRLSFTFSGSGDDNAVRFKAIRLDDGTTAFNTTALDGGVIPAAVKDVAAPILIGAAGATSNGQPNFTLVPAATKTKPINAIIGDVRLFANNVSEADIDTFANRQLDSAHSSETGTTGLRGYWRLDDRTGATVNDSVASLNTTYAVNNGTLEPLRPRFVAGLTADEQGYAVRFDGYTDRGVIPVTAATATQEGYTRHFCRDSAGTVRPVWCIEFRVKLNSSNVSQTLLRWVTSGAANICTITTAADGTLRVNCGAQKSDGTLDADSTVTGVIALVVGTEYHIAAVRELTAATPAETDFKLYLDGVQDGSTNTTTSGRAYGPDGNAADILIAQGSAATSNFDLTIDELRIWDNAQSADAAVVARTVTQINQYKDKPLPQKEIDTAISGTHEASDAGFMLIGYWKCDDNHREFNDAPQFTTDASYTFGQIAASDSGRSQFINAVPVSTSSMIGGLPMFLRPGSHAPQWCVGILRGAVDGALLDALLHYKTTGGTDELHLLAQGTLQKLASGTSLPTTLSTVTGAASGIDGGRPASSVIMRDRIYFTNGLRQPHCYDGTSVRNWGIQGPTAPAILTRAPVTGGVTGDVQYRYTYVSRASGTESDPSPSSAVFRPPGSTHGLAVYVYHSPESQVDTIRIYRTTHGATSGNPRPGSSDFFLVDEITNTGTVGTLVSYADSVGDASLGYALGGSEQGFTTSGPPPWFQYAVVFNGRVFGAVDPRDEKTKVRLYFSEQNQPEKWPASNFIDFESGEGEPITGLGVLYDRLFVFKRSAVYVLSGYGPSSHQKQQLTNGLGCISHFSIKAVDGWLYFMSDRGPYRTNGIEWDWIGREILSTFTGFDKTSLDECVAGIVRDRYQIWFALSSASGTRNDRVFVWDWTTRAWSLFRGIRAQCMVSTIDSTGVNRLFFGDDRGYAWRADASVTRNDGDTGFSAAGTSGVITAVGTAGNYATVTIADDFVSSSTNDGWRGLRIEIDDVSGGVTGESIILNADSLGVLTLDTVNFPLGFTAAVNDTYRIAAIDAVLDTRPIALQSPSLYSHVYEIEVDGRYTTDANSGTASLSTVTPTVGEADDYSSTFTTTTRAITVGSGSAVTNAVSFDRFNLPARVRRYQVRVANDRVHEGFEVKSLTVRHAPAERT